MNWAGNTTAPLPTAGRAGGATADATDLVATLSAYAYLWPCRRVGARARTFGRPLLVNGVNVEIGDDAVLDSRGGRVELAAARRGRLVLGHRVRIGSATRLVANGLVEIGDGTSIGAGCLVSDGEGGGGTPGSDIWIGDGVTLGDRVRVLPGTVIGAGAVIAAGAVVGGRIAPGARVGAGGAGAEP